MSMIGFFKQITSSQLRDLLQDPSIVEKLLYPDQNDSLSDEGKVPGKVSHPLLEQAKTIILEMMRRFNKSGSSSREASPGISPDTSRGAAFGELDSVGMIDVDKSWQGIHYLLTGDPLEGDLPLCKTVFGTEIGEDLGYGPAMYLTVDEVRSIAEALKLITQEEMGRRFDENRESMRSADLYTITGEDDDRGYILEYYDKLRCYYLDAASRGNAMLIHIG